MPPTATLAELAHAIDVAFARWDFAHGHAFTLPDGRRASDIDDDRPEDELDSKTVRLSSLRFHSGDRFEYVFDLGDDWTHECTVVRSSADPDTEWGGTPTGIVATFGWGSIPDQYGRVTPNPEADDAEPTDAENAIDEDPRRWTK